MSIRDEKNKLFEEWQKQYKEDDKKTFFIDGCPNPEAYLEKDRKVLFVLKDANLGNPDLGDNCKKFESGVLGCFAECKDNFYTYDLMEELSKPKKELKGNKIWWVTIARWAYLLQNPSKTWGNVKSEITDKEMQPICDILAHYGIMQLKKTWGGGSIENKTLATVVDKDKDFIYRQILIHQPNFIVACGNGWLVKKVFKDKIIGDDYYTSDGVGYWKIKIDDRLIFLIDYCHPSNRAGKKVDGLIAKGLNSAILEIEKIKV